MPKGIGWRWRRGSWAVLHPGSFCPSSLRQTKSFQTCHPPRSSPTTANTADTPAATFVRNPTWPSHPSTPSHSSPPRWGGGCDNSARYPERWRVTTTAPTARHAHRSHYVRGRRGQGVCSLWIVFFGIEAPFWTIRHRRRRHRLSFWTWRFCQRMGVRYGTRSMRSMDLPILIQTSQRLGQCVVGASILPLEYRRAFAVLRRW
mmetsp:Transcript_16572/g.29906  ORF Transcript_16572/g.29906 Transcript_16572/m.29906 type:complete len:203 (-) Transcript_16572:273-881(-)